MLPDPVGLIAGILLLLVWFWVAWELKRINEIRARVAGDLLRQVALAGELLWLSENRDKLAEWQEISEKTLDEGTATARAIHHAIAAIPFGILEAIPATRDTTRIVHGVHDLTADSVYAGISIANRLLGRQLRESLAVTEDRVAASEKDARSVTGNGPGRSKIDKLP